jgi:predicted amidohydrolase YtcJ
MIYDLPGGPLWRGYPLESSLELTEKVVQLHCAGWQIAIHGNGDDAIQTILDAYEEANKRYPRADARHIIMHCQTVREDQLDRIGRLGVMPSFFVTHTYFWGDRHYAIFLGPDRAERISPLRSALQRGIRFSIHNDTPVTPINPLLSVWSAVNRLTSGGDVLGANQTIPVMDALRGVTIWAACQNREEHLKGSLEPGKLADMVILDSNPLTAQPQDIKNIGIAAVMVGGKNIFGF